MVWQYIKHYWYINQNNVQYYINSNWLYCEYIDDADYIIVINVVISNMIITIPT